MKLGLAVVSNDGGRGQAAPANHRTEPDKERPNLRLIPGGLGKTAGLLEPDRLDRPASDVHLLRAKAVETKSEMDPGLSFSLTPSRPGFHETNGAVLLIEAHASPGIGFGDGDCVEKSIARMKAIDAFPWEDWKNLPTELDREVFLVRVLLTLPRYDSYGAARASSSAYYPTRSILNQHLAVHARFKLLKAGVLSDAELEETGGRRITDLRALVGCGLSLQCE